MLSNRPGRSSSLICLGPSPKSRKNLPSRSMPSRISERGIVAWKPAAMIGVTIMKMMSSTSITSISGVTLMSALTADLALALVTDRATGLRRLLRLEFLGEDRAAELRADALDQVVDLGAEVVVQPYGGNGDDEAERGRDERFRDTGRHRGERAAAARRRHAREGVHDPHHGAEQSHERGGRARRREDAQAALQLRRDDQHLARHGPLHRVDVGGGDRGAVAQQRLHFRERLADHARHVAALLFLGQLDRAVQLLLLQEARELGRELLRLLLGAPQLPQLLERAGPRDQRHQEQHDDDELRERAHRDEQIVEREAHVLEAPYRPVILKSIGMLISTRTARPCTRAGRNSAFSTYVLAG